VAAISAGCARMGALTTGGEVRCLGYNYYGQLCNGTLTDSSIPVDVIGLQLLVVVIVNGTRSWAHSLTVVSRGDPSNVNQRRIEPHHRPLKAHRIAAETRHPFPCVRNGQKS
jgi:hypothetical protein